MWLRRQLVMVPIRLAVASLIICSFFVLTQDFQIFPGVMWRWTGGAAPEEPPTGVDRFTVTTADGEKITVHRQAAQGDRRAVVLIFGGNANTLASLAGLQTTFASRGVTSYAFSYRGYESSTGWPSEQGIYRDADAVSDEAIRREGISREKLTVWGQSIGTGPASYTASRLQSEAIVLAAPYYDLPSVVRGLPLFSLLTPLLWYEFPNHRYLSNSKNTCLTLAHGKADSTIPFRHSEMLMTTEGMPSDRRLIGVDGVGHNDLLAAALPQILASLEACWAKREGRPLGRT